MNSKLELVKEKIEEIKNAMNSGVPAMAIAKDLDIKYDTLKRNLKKLGVNVKTNQNRKGIVHHEGRKSALDYINGNYIHNSTLCRKLIEDGIKEYRCEKCGKDEYEGEKIPLELHHINCHHYDNRLENLMVVCPTCHAIIHRHINEETKQERLSKRKTKKHDKKSFDKICLNPECNKHFIASDNRQQFCSVECMHKFSRRNIPEKDKLIELLSIYKSFCGVGKVCGVSDNAVRKWCKKYGLPKNKNEIKQMFGNAVVPELV